MNPKELYRAEKRIQNNQNKYYMVCEIFSASKKFTASRLIKSGISPSKSEIFRAFGIYGFDLHNRCIVKAAKYISKKTIFDRYADEDDCFELERYRFLTELSQKLDMDKTLFISKYPKVNLSEDEISEMYRTGKIPRGKSLDDINLVQNIKKLNSIKISRKLSIKNVVKIRKVIYENLNCRELLEEDKKEISDAVDEYVRKIQEGFCSAEQCFILAEKIDDPLLSSALFCMSAKSYGYNLPPYDNWNDLISSVKQNSEFMEHRIRKIIEKEFGMVSGAKQKKLDIF